MSDLDYYTGKALENDYIAQQRADASMSQQLGKLEQQRSSALQGAAINNEKLMKYLPQQLKAAGMSNLGVAQSSYIRQANNYASERGAINQSFNDAESNVMSAYADAQAERDIARNNAITDLEKYYGEKADAEAKEKKTKLENSVRNMVNNGIAASRTKEEILAEVSVYKDQLDPIVWAEIESAINSGESLRLKGEAEEAEADAEEATAKADSAILSSTFENMTQEQFDAWLAQFPNASQEAIALAKEKYRLVQNGELTAEQEKKDNEFLTLVDPSNYATAEEMKAAIEANKAGVSDYAVKLAETWMNKFTADEEAEAAAKSDAEATALAGSLEMRVYNGIASGYSKEQLQALIDPYKGQIEQRVWEDLQEMINADEIMDANEAKEKATEIANDNIDFYITNGLYKDDSPEEFFLWMEAHAADADDEVFDRAMDMYRQNAADQIREENERAEAEAKSEAEKAAAEKRSNADAMISEIIGSFTGTPEELANELAPYMENASELAKEYAEYYQRIYRTDYEEVEGIEKDSRVLEGKETLTYNGQKWRIVGSEISSDEVWEMLNKNGQSGDFSPYASDLKNGMTFSSGKKTYTYYNGGWYPSTSEGYDMSETTIVSNSGNVYDMDIIKSILNGR